MAKLGEGDSRWIVNDVGNAAANDNGWHWKEYDALEWSNKRLKEMFKFMTLIEDPHMKLEVTSLQSCDGEAFINNRKSKLIPSYELEVKLWWKGEAKDGEGKTSALAHGSIHFPYIADENHDEEPEVKFLLIEQVELFVSELRAGGPVGAKELAKEAANKSAAASASSAAAGSQPGASKAAEAAPAPAPASKPKAPKPKGGLQTLKMTEKFYAKPSDIYECFTDENKIKAFTQSKASVEPKAGGKFSWFEGAVHGEFVEMEKDKHLVMKWKFSTWADSAWSKVDIRLGLPEFGTPILNLVHSNIPKEYNFGLPVDIRLALPEIELSQFSTTILNVDMRLEQPEVGTTILNLDHTNIPEEYMFEQPVDIRLELPEVGTTILNLVHTDIPEEDKIGQPVLDTTDSYNKVDIRLELPEVGTTILNLVHTDIPEEDKFGQPVLETTEKGWKNQILQRIRQVFGYGV
eukprot:gene10631-12312_t